MSFVFSPHQITVEPDVSRDGRWVNMKVFIPNDVAKYGAFDELVTGDRFELRSVGYAEKVIAPESVPAPQGTHAGTW